MKTEKLTFHHTQTSSETALLKIITTRILNLPRIMIWVFFTVCLLACLILAVNDANSVYAVPLVIFAGLLSCCSLGLLIFTLISRPRLLQNIADGDGLSFTLSFQPDSWMFQRSNPPAQMGNYKCIIGQYWLLDSYILHLRPSSKHSSHGDELILLPLNEDTFDHVYILANALFQRHIRLIRIKGKK